MQGQLFHGVYWAFSVHGRTVTFYPEGRGPVSAKEGTLTGLSPPFLMVLRSLSSKSCLACTRVAVQNGWAIAIVSGEPRVVFSRLSMQLRTQ